MSKGNAHLPLPALRLLVPPLRLVSAAVWQNIQQKVVLHYGTIEEFVSMVTEMVPSLLTGRHRAQLILGLRARQILELCRLEPLTDFETMQPHLDRMQMLIEAWLTEAGGANVIVPQSNFVDLVQNLMINPEEREHFFQKVFLEEFGPTYDEALQTLMWLFLFRLEKFLPFYTFQQVASMFAEVPSVLEDCMQSQFEGLRILLQNQKGISQLDDSETSFDGGCIISALKLSTMDRTDSQDILMTETEKAVLNLPPAAAQIQTEQQTCETITNKTNRTFGKVATRQESPSDLTSQIEDSSCNLKECHVQMRRLDVPASLDNLHVLSKNTGKGVIKPLYKCDKCEEAFRSTVLLQKHKITHDELYCDVCRKVLQDAATVEKHKASHTPFQCIRCDETFTVFKLLLRHCKNIHDIYQPFKCSHCPKTSSRLPFLIRHEWTHTGHLPIKCVQCNSKFWAFGELIQHERVHTREKPYRCSECGKTFSLNCNLLRHLRLIHSKAQNEKNKTHCEDVQKISEKTTLKKHKKKRHVQIETPDAAASSQTRPVRQNRGQRMKKFLQEEKRGHHESESRKFSRACPTLSDDTDSDSSNNDASYMAPISDSDDDSGSDCSYKDSHHSTVDNTQPVCSQDESLNNPTEQDSSSSCLDKDSSLQGSTIIQASSKKPDIKYQKKVRKIPCLICKEHIDTSLHSHMKMHFPTDDYTCPQCDSRFKNLGLLKQHLFRTCYEHVRQHVNPEKPDERPLYKCDKCEEAFRSKVSLQKHTITHNELYCNVCRKVLQDAETVEKHKASHTPFQCIRCDETFTVFRLLLRHCKNIHNIYQPFKCSHCPKTSSRLGFLIRHEWSHTGHLPIQCVQCNAKFWAYGELIQHERVHTREKPYLCSECGKTFSLNCNLLRHLRRVHNKVQSEKKYSCSLCEKLFQQKRYLKMHQKRKHLKEIFRHPCPYCGKMLSPSTMTRHMLIHTGEKPFKCTEPECEKYFRSVTEVKKHVLIHHTTDRPYKCDVCGKGFIKWYLLKSHSKVHSGEKPFSCHICGKAFPKLYSMRRHTKLVHTNVTE